MMSSLRRHLSQRPLPLLLGLLLIVMAAGALFVLQDYHKTLVHERQNKARQMVENATNLVTYYESKAERGELDENKAKYYALETIRQIMPEPNGYFWVIDTYPHGIMHPMRQKWEGADLSTYVGPDGQRLFLNIVQLVQQQGSGYVNYQWAKPDRAGNAAYSKVSFVQLYKPWKWIIGTGVYVEDIESAFWNAVLITCGLAVAILMFIMALAITISESLKKTSAGV